MPRHVVVAGRRWPGRYFSRTMRLQRARELLQRRRVPYAKLRMGRTDLVRQKKSRWTDLFHRVYPGLKFNKQLISQATGIPVRILDTVYDRGLKAWKTSGSRPGANPQQWATARVYKFVLVSKQAWNPRDPNQNLRR